MYANTDGRQLILKDTLQALLPAVCRLLLYEGTDCRAEVAKNSDRAKDVHGIYRQQFGTISYVYEYHPLSLCVLNSRFFFLI